MEQLTVFKRNSRCHFCGTSKNDYLTYGPIYKLGEVTVHYYCLLLSNELIQNGKDEEGILGFLLSDIQSELERATNILCIYCKRQNATITCAATKCRKSFHLPCGLRNGSSHQFVRQFKSYCHIHRLVQNIPERILKEAYKTKIICCICQEVVNVKRKRNILWAPCCRKTWYHRKCVQKLAHSAGYFCRCPACNDAKKFNEWMRRFGIFIPKHDASWELVPNAFEELLFRYNKCDAEVCKCPGGRQSSTDNTMWEIILCESCGSQGIHVACGNLRFLDPEWECPACQRITKGSKSPKDSGDPSKADEGSSKQLKLPEVGQKKRRRGSEGFENSVLDKRKKFRGNVEDEEVEIDVVTVDEEAGNDDKSPTEPVEKSRDVENIRDAQPEQSKTAVQLTSNALEVLTQLKPGPLSYKLSLLRRVGGHLLPPIQIQQGGNESGNSNPKRTDVIELSDSEEEKEADSDLEVIEETASRSKKNTGREMVNMEDFEILAVVSVQKSKDDSSSCIQQSETAIRREHRHCNNRPSLSPRQDTPDGKSPCDIADAEREQLKKACRPLTMM